MRVLTIFAVAALASTSAIAAGSDQPTVYPYASSANYCPAGLQPVSINGTVCCGTPNTNMTYQQATAAPRRRAHSRSCPIGVKGC
ncbi:MAG: hypothetical protein AB3N23_13510 [Paracoccaceae bacterium]